MIVCLDIGHGGADPGAVGNGLRESDLTEIITQGVAKRLLSYHVEIYNVPRSDSLADRAQFANDLNADLFVSVHVNAEAAPASKATATPPRPLKRRSIRTQSMRP